ncbi:aminopeptidase P family protein [Pokkaliibacter sp. CJK22405]|uniref:aminopeptidase P family protein n=1 Tax=Pokkaliibacter sp. CJK22405 TaxID=3384615 RepID=UPI0039851982
MTTTVSQVHSRLTALRQAMHSAGVDACLIPSADPHLSEYLPERWQGRAWLSGFTGSVGTLIVLKDWAGLWVDSRYWEQAASQLAGTGIELMKLVAVQQVGWVDWLAEHLADGNSIAVDGQVLSLGLTRLLEQKLLGTGIQLRADLDLLESIWPDRASLPQAPVYPHPEPYAVASRADRLAQVREAMKAAGADWLLISTVDDLAWVTGLRGADVDYNPVFVGHLLLGQERGLLFVAEGKVDQALLAALEDDDIAVEPYDAIAGALSSLPVDATLMYDPARVTGGIVGAVAEGVKRVEQIGPTTLLKSRKSAAEAAHIREAMAEDGAALCEFFAWLEEALARGESITELTIDEQITAARARRPNYICPSFATIAGFNANGALPHYRATQEAHSVIEGDGLLLIDSGGQYLGGTTDITRVVPVGETSAAQKRDVALVFKGMMALSRAQFPHGIKSPQLDAIARAPLWAEGIDYGHGTGHGVGYFLNVHEGPQVISYHAQPAPQTTMLPGMITSIEPGIYRPGKWGVRIENLVMNQDLGELEFGSYLAFETLTLCPIDTRCMDLGLLQEDEKSWLNTYHALVRERLLPKVSGSARDWLVRRTEPV